MVPAACGFMPQPFPAEIVQGRCVNTMEMWCWPQENLWCPHLVSVEVFPSWQAGADGRRRNSLFLSWLDLVNCSLGAVACVGWDLTLVSVSSTAGPEKAHFPTPQHCWTICPWLHWQAMTSVLCLSPQRSSMILEDHNSGHLNFS